MSKAYTAEDSGGAVRIAWYDSGHGGREAFARFVLEWLGSYPTDEGNPPPSQLDLCEWADLATFGAWVEGAHPTPPGKNWGQMFREAHYAVVSYEYVGHGDADYFVKEVA